MKRRTALTIFKFVALVGFPVFQPLSAESDFEFKSQIVGEWFVYAQYDYCNMMIDVERQSPENRVSFHLAYFPDKNSSLLAMDSPLWRSLSKKDHGKVPVSFQFDGSGVETSGLARVMAGAKITPGFHLSVDAEATAKFLETLKHSARMNVVADGRPIGSYEFAESAVGVDKLMECVAAARSALEKDPFR